MATPRVLFVQPKNSCDYLASMIWDGLQEVLGEENVVDAAGCPWLHRSGCDGVCLTDKDVVGRVAQGPVVRAISGTREGVTIQEGGGGFDVLVIFSSFNRDFTWHEVFDWARRLNKGAAKVAYVEGWDGASQYERPQMAVDRVFRKEIDPSVAYPYEPTHLGFAFPSRWLLDGTERFDRPLDVFWSGNPDACLPGREVRWPMLGQAFRTRRHHRSVLASYGLGYDHYFALLRQAKLALCPSGADLTDSLRTFEAVACGAVPVFVGYPPWRREPWFPPEACISCTADTLPEHLDEALSHDLGPRRRAMLDCAREHHTTAARATQMLRALGVTP